MNGLDSKDLPLKGEEIGEIVIKGDGQSQRYVINMMGQYYPGYPSHELHTNREKYFQQCLDKMSAIKDLDSVAFPYLIGCGLAGGYWPNYYKMIQDFSEKVNAKVVIYQLPD